MGTFFNTKFRIIMFKPAVFSLYMRHQISFASGGIRTAGTLERFLPRVNHNVSIEAALVAE